MFAFASVTTLLALTFAGGVFLGWVILPCPQVVRDWWARQGWAKP